MSDSTSTTTDVSSDENSATDKVRKSQRLSRNKDDSATSGRMSYQRKESRRDDASRSMSRESSVSSSMTRQRASSHDSESTGPRSSRRLKARNIRNKRISKTVASIVPGQSDSDDQTRLVRSKRSKVSRGNSGTRESDSVAEDATTTDDDSANEGDEDEESQSGQISLRTRRSGRASLEVPAAADASSAKRRTRSCDASNDKYKVISDVVSKTRSSERTGGSCLQETNKSCSSSADKSTDTVSASSIKKEILSDDGEEGETEYMDTYESQSSNESSKSPVKKERIDNNKVQNQLAAAKIRETEPTKVTSPNIPISSSNEATRTSSVSCTRKHQTSIGVLKKRASQPRRRTNNPKEKRLNDVLGSVAKDFGDNIDEGHYSKIERDLALGNKSPEKQQRGMTSKKITNSVQFVDPKSTKLLDTSISGGANEANESLCSDITNGLNSAMFYSSSKSSNNLSFNQSSSGISKVDGATSSLKTPRRGAFNAKKLSDVVRCLAEKKRAESPLTGATDDKPDFLKDLKKNNSSDIKQRQVREVFHAPALDACVSSSSSFPMSTLPSLTIPQISSNHTSTLTVTASVVSASTITSNSVQLPLPCTATTNVLPLPLPCTTTNSFLSQASTITPGIQNLSQTFTSPSILQIPVSNKTTIGILQLPQSCTTTYTNQLLSQPCTTAASILQLPVMCLTSESISKVSFSNITSSVIQPTRTITTSSCLSTLTSASVSPSATGHLEALSSPAKSPVKSTSLTSVVCAKSLPSDSVFNNPGVTGSVNSDSCAELSKTCSDVCTTQSSALPHANEDTESVVVGNDANKVKQVNSKNSVRLSERKLPYASKVSTQSDAQRKCKISPPVFIPSSYTKNADVKGVSVHIEASSNSKNRVLAGTKNKRPRDSKKLSGNNSVNNNIASSSDVSDTDSSLCYKSTSSPSTSLPASTTVPSRMFYGSGACKSSAAERVALSHNLIVPHLSKSPLAVTGPNKNISSNLRQGALNARQTSSKEVSSSKDCAKPKTSQVPKDITKKSPHLLTSTGVHTSSITITPKSKTNQKSQSPVGLTTLNIPKVIPGYRSRSSSVGANSTASTSGADVFNSDEIPSITINCDNSEIVSLTSTVTATYFTTKPISLGATSSSDVDSCSLVGTNPTPSNSISSVSGFSDLKIPSVSISGNVAGFENSTLPATPVSQDFCVELVQSDSTSIPLNVTMPPTPSATPIPQPYSCLTNAIPPQSSISTFTSLAGSNILPSHILAPSPAPGSLTQQNIQLSGLSESIPSQIVTSLATSNNFLLPMSGTSFSGTGAPIGSGTHLPTIMTPLPTSMAPVANTVGLPPNALTNLQVSHLPPGAVANIAAQGGSLTNLQTPGLVPSVPTPPGALSNTHDVNAVSNYPPTVTPGALSNVPISGLSTNSVANLPGTIPALPANMGQYANSVTQLTGNILPLPNSVGPLTTNINNPVTLTSSSSALNTIASLPYLPGPVASYNAGVQTYVTSAPQLAYFDTTTMTYVTPAILPSLATPQGIITASSVSSFVPPGVTLPPSYTIMSIPSQSMASVSANGVTLGESDATQVAPGGQSLTVTGTNMARDSPLLVSTPMLTSANNSYASNPSDTCPVYPIQAGALNSNSGTGLQSSQFHGHVLPSSNLNNNSRPVLFPSSGMVVGSGQSSTSSPAKQTKQIHIAPKPNRMTVPMGSVPSTLNITNNKSSKPIQIAPKLSTQSITVPSPVNKLQPTPQIITTPQGSHLIHTIPQLQTLQAIPQNLQAFPQSVQPVQTLPPHLQSIAAGVSGIPVTQTLSLAATQLVQPPVGKILSQSILVPALRGAESSDANLSSSMAPQYSILPQQFVNSQPGCEKSSLTTVTSALGSSPDISYSNPVLTSIAPSMVTQSMLPNIQNSPSVSDGVVPSSVTISIPSVMTTVGNSFGVVSGFPQSFQNNTVGQPSLSSLSVVPPSCSLSSSTTNPTCVSGTALVYPNSIGQSTLSNESLSLNTPIVSLQNAAIVNQTTIAASSAVQSSTPISAPTLTDRSIISNDTGSNSSVDDRLTEVNDGTRINSDPTCELQICDAPEDNPDSPVSTSDSFIDVTGIYSTDNEDKQEGNISTENVKISEKAEVSVKLSAEPTVSVSNIVDETLDSTHVSVSQSSLLEESFIKSNDKYPKPSPIKLTPVSVAISSSANASSKFQVDIEKTSNTAVTKNTAVQQKTVVEASNISLSKPILPQIVVSTPVRGGSTNSFKFCGPKHLSVLPAPTPRITRGVVPLAQVSTGSLAPSALVPSRLLSPATSKTLISPLAKNPSISVSNIKNATTPSPKVDATRRQSEETSNANLESKPEVKRLDSKTTAANAGSETSKPNIKNLTTFPSFASSSVTLTSASSNLKQTPKSPSPANKVALEKKKEPLVKKSLFRTKSQENVSKSSYAFSVVNESSVYAFEPDDCQQEENSAFSKRLKKKSVTIAPVKLNRVGSNDTNKTQESQTAESISSSDVNHKVKSNNDINVKATAENAVDKHKRNSRTAFNQKLKNRSISERHFVDQTTSETQLNLDPSVASPVNTSSVNTSVCSNSTFESTICDAATVNTQTIHLTSISPVGQTGEFSNTPKTSGNVGSAQNAVVAEVINAVNSQMVTNSLGSGDSTGQPASSSEMVTNLIRAATSAALGGARFGNSADGVRFLNASQASSSFPSNPMAKLEAVSALAASTNLDLLSHVSASLESISTLGVASSDGASDTNATTSQFSKNLADNEASVQTACEASANSETNVGVVSKDVSKSSTAENSKAVQSTSIAIQCDMDEPSPTLFRPEMLSVNNESGTQTEGPSNAKLPLPPSASPFYYLPLAMAALGEKLPAQLVQQMLAKTQGLVGAAEAGMILQQAAQLAQQHQQKVQLSGTTDVPLPESPHVAKLVPSTALSSVSVQPGKHTAEETTLVQSAMPDPSTVGKVSSGKSSSNVTAKTINQIQKQPVSSSPDISKRQSNVPPQVANSSEVTVPSSQMEQQKSKPQQKSSHIPLFAPPTHLSSKSSAQPLSKAQPIRAVPMNKSQPKGGFRNSKGIVGLSRSSASVARLASAPFVETPPLMTASPPVYITPPPRITSEAFNPTPAYMAGSLSSHGKKLIGSTKKDDVSSTSQSSPTKSKTSHKTGSRSMPDPSKAVVSRASNSSQSPQSIPCATVSQSISSKSIPSTTNSCSSTTTFILNSSVTCGPAGVQPSNAIPAKSANRVLRLDPKTQSLVINPGTSSSTKLQREIPSSEIRDVPVKRSLDKSRAKQSRSRSCDEAFTNKKLRLDNISDLDNEPSLVLTSIKPVANEGVIAENLLINDESRKAKEDDHVVPDSVNRSAKSTEKKSGLKTNNSETSLTNKSLSVLADANQKLMEFSKEVSSKNCAKHVSSMPKVTKDTKNLENSKSSSEEESDSENESSTSVEKSRKRVGRSPGNMKHVNRAKESKDNTPESNVSRNKSEPTKKSKCESDAETDQSLDSDFRESKCSQQNKSTDSVDDQGSKNRKSKSETGEKKKLSDSKSINLDDDADTSADVPVVRRSGRSSTSAATRATESDQQGVEQLKRHRRAKRAAAALARDDFGGAPDDFEDGRPSRRGRRRKGSSGGGSGRVSSGGSGWVSPSGGSDAGGLPPPPLSPHMSPDTLRGWPPPRLTR